MMGFTVSWNYIYLGVIFWFIVKYGKVLYKKMFDQGTFDVDTAPPNRESLVCLYMHFTHILQTILIQLCLSILKKI